MVRRQEEQMVPFRTGTKIRVPSFLPPVVPWPFHLVS